MSIIKAVQSQLGLSVTPANNFSLDASAGNGTMKLARGNAGATTQDIFTVGADGVITATQGIVTNRMVRTATQSASGTLVTFPGAPSWAKRITVEVKGISSTGTGIPQVRVGSGGSVDSTGYSGSIAIFAASTVLVTYTDGFYMATSAVAANTYTGRMVLEVQDGDEWTSVYVGRTSPSNVYVGQGEKTLSGTLDTVSVAIPSGTFDGGTVSVMYEG